VIQIGPFAFDQPVALAPMAGVTDKPFRQLCRQLGASFAATEMIISDQRLWNSEKSRFRLDHEGEGEPVIVQIAGGDADMIAGAALENIRRGAAVIDINMGCPAKKVCNKAAGSALMKDEDLVARILDAAVSAAAPNGVPVTLKTRTGWDPEHRNGIRVARLAEDAGVAAIAMHGRTRACMYRGAAEYDSIRAVRAAVRIPVLANGDIDSPHKAAQVLARTGAHGLLVGRAAQGRPWIFREIRHYLATGRLLAEPEPCEVRDIMLDHLDALYRFYGEARGVRTARKHLGWYLAGRPGGERLRQRIVKVESAPEQLALVGRYFEEARYNGLAA
jgi:tRNA-dihydrouridine synthase B